MIGEEKGSVAISGRSSHKMTGLRVLCVVLNSNFDRLSCFNRRLIDAELGKVISDVRNNVPTGKVFEERICKNIVHKCCRIIVHSFRFFNCRKKGIALYAIKKLLNTILSTKSIYVDIT